MAYHDEVDVFIIGGGINGTGIARDAAGQGVRVMLCEQGDLAEHTSSRSSKLIHGGLRYLEQYEFRMVRKALQEREVLMAIAPHIVWPIPLVIPHNEHIRPAWQVRLGLFIYDHLAKRAVIPSSSMINLKKDKRGATIDPRYTTGFQVYDCWVQDARLVILNALDAQRLGAKILTRTKVTEVKPKDGGWVVKAVDDKDQEYIINTRVVINATGPFMQEVSRMIAMDKVEKIHMVRGSHIVVKKWYEGNHAYLLQCEDKRVVFILPFEEEYVLIGTTENRYHENPANVRISASERAYLCHIIDQYFHQSIKEKDVIYSFCGVRPLIGGQDDKRTREMSRDYKVKLEKVSGSPVIQILGGKLTTYRRLAEDVMTLIMPLFNKQPKRWTHEVLLPGGDLPNKDPVAYENSLLRRYPWIDPMVLKRYVRNYGTRTEMIMQGTKHIYDMGWYYGATLFEKEARYLMEHEWAKSVEDILYRRTKQGVALNAEQIEGFTDWYERTLGIRV